MTTRLAISGFGRIGRMVLRAFVESGRDDVEIVLINTPGPVETSAHLYEFDSVHGRVGSHFIRRGLDGCRHRTHCDDA